MIITYRSDHAIPLSRNCSRRLETFIFIKWRVHPFNVGGKVLQHILKIILSWFHLFKALDEFIIVFSVIGKIFYVSENITCLLGHTPVIIHNNSQQIVWSYKTCFSFQNDLIGTNMIDLVWEDERLLVESLLSSWGSAHDDSNNKGINVTFGSYGHQL